MARDLSYIFNLVTPDTLQQDAALPSVSNPIAFDDIGDFVQERQRIQRKLESLKDAAPKPDFSDYANHVFFDSALSKLSIAKDRILTKYPFNGDTEDLDLFQISSSLYEQWLTKQWPTSQGYLNYKNTATFVTASDMQSKLWAGSSSLYVSVRIKPGLPSVQYNVLSVLSGNGTIGHNYGYTLFAGTTAATFRLYSGSFQYDYTANFATASMVPGTFNTVAFQYDTNANQVSMFLNGSKKLVQNNVNLNNQLQFGPATITVGSNYSGCLDEVRVLTTASELFHDKYYNQPIASEPYVALNYRFNEGITGYPSYDQTVVDYSPNGLHGAIVNYTGTFRVSGSTALNDAGDLILYPVHPAVVAFTASLEDAAKIYDAQNRNYIMRLIPEQILEDDQDAQGILINFSLAMARFFDDLKMYFDQFDNLRISNYENVNESPDLMLPLMKQYFGWKVTDHFSTADPLQFLFGEKVLPSGSIMDTTLLEIKNQFWRRILNNLPYLYKSKGKHDSVESFFNVLGINPNLINLKEFGSVHTSQIGDEYLTKEKSMYFANFYGASGVNSPAIYMSGSTLTLEVVAKPINDYGQNITPYHDIFGAINNDNGLKLALVYDYPVDASTKQAAFHVVGTINGQTSLSQPPVYVNIFDSGFTHFSMRYSATSKKVVVEARQVNEGTLTSSSFSVSNVTFPISGNIYFAFGSNLGGSLKAAGEYGQGRAWSRYLSHKDLDAHAFNFENVAESLAQISGSSLLVHYGLNENLTADASGNINGIIDLSRQGRTGSMHNVPAYGNPYVSELIDYSYLSPMFDLKWTQNKIRIRNKSKLLPSEIADDTNKVTLEFNLIDALNEDIAKIFSTMDDMNTVLGQPVNKYRDSYVDLQAYSQYYFQRLTDSINFTKFFKLFRWFDKKLATSIQQLLPARTDFIGGEFVVDSHMLERNKYQYLYPVFHTPKDIKDANVVIGDTDSHKQVYIEDSRYMAGTSVNSLLQDSETYPPDQSQQDPKNFGLRYEVITPSIVFAQSSAKQPKKLKSQIYGDWKTTFFYWAQDFAGSDTPFDEFVQTLDGLVINPNWMNHTEDDTYAAYFQHWNDFNPVAGVLSYKVSASLTPSGTGFDPTLYNVFYGDGQSGSFWQNFPDTAHYGTLTAIADEPGWYQFRMALTGVMEPMLKLVDVVANTSNNYAGFFIQLNQVNTQYYFSDMRVDFTASLTDAGYRYFYPPGLHLTARQSSVATDAALMPRFKTAFNDQREKFTRHQNFGPIKVSGDDAENIRSPYESLNYKNEFAKKLESRQLRENKDGYRSGTFIDSRLTSGLWRANGNVFSDVHSDNSDPHYHGINKTMVVNFQADFRGARRFQPNQSGIAGTYIAYGVAYDGNGAPINDALGLYYKKYSSLAYSPEPMNAVLTYYVSASQTAAGNGFNTAEFDVKFTDFSTQWPYPFTSFSGSISGSTRALGTFTPSTVDKQPGWYKFTLNMYGQLRPNFLLQGYQTGSNATMFGFTIYNSASQYVFRDVNLTFNWPLSDAGVDYYYKLDHEHTPKVTTFLNQKLFRDSGASLYAGPYWPWNQPPSYTLRNDGVVANNVFGLFQSSFKLLLDSTGTARLIYVDPNYGTFLTSIVGNQMGQVYQLPITPSVMPNIMFDVYNTKFVYVDALGTDNVRRFLVSSDNGKTWQINFNSSGLTTTSLNNPYPRGANSQGFWYWLEANGALIRGYYNRQNLFSQNTFSNFSSASGTFGIIADANSSNLYVFGVPSSGNAQIWQSTNNGGSWQLVWTAPSSTETPAAMAVAPPQSPEAGSVYITTFSGPGGTPRLYRSLNGSSGSFSLRYTLTNGDAGGEMVWDARGNAYWHILDDSTYSTSIEYLIAGSQTNSYINVDQLALQTTGIRGVLDLKSVGDDIVQLVAAYDPVVQSAAAIFTRRAKLTRNATFLGPSSLASSTTFVSNFNRGVVTTAQKLGNVSEFPHYGGLFQMRNLVLGTVDKGLLGTTDDAIVQVQHVGSVVNVMWPDQTTLTAPVPGFGELSPGQSPGNLSTTFTYGQPFDVSGYDHVSLYCYAQVQQSGTLDDLMLQIQRRPLSSVGFATNQALSSSYISNASTEVRYSDVSHVKQIDYGDITTTLYSYVIDVPLKNLREIRIGAKQRNGQAGPNQNFLVWGRFIDSKKET